MKELLARPEREIEVAQDPDEALALAERTSFDLVISDINLNARLNGLDVLRSFKGANPEAQVLLISGFGSLETAIDAVRNGAFDFISKPFNIGEVKAVVDRALAQSRRRDAEAPAAARRPAGGPARAAARRCCRSTSRSPVPPTRPRPCSIIGESGTGKELVARAIHEHSGARARGRSSRSTAARSPRRCWSRSCSATCAARSPARSPTRRASSSRGTSARCSSTRSGRRRRRCR